MTLFHPFSLIWKKIFYHHSCCIGRDHLNYSMHHRVSFCCGSCTDESKGYIRHCSEYVETFKYVEKRIGVEFKNKSLLIQAFTHSSFYKPSEPQKPNYQVNLLKSCSLTHHQCSEIGVVRRFSVRICCDFGFVSEISNCR